MLMGVNSHTEKVTEKYWFNMQTHDTWKQVDRTFNNINNTNNNNNNNNKINDNS